MKLAERVLDTCIRFRVSIDDMQFCFVPGKSITDTMFFVHQLQEKFTTIKKKPLYCAFLDLEKAFDHVLRKVTILSTLGVEEWAVRVIQGMYSSTRSCVRINGQYSKEIKVGFGAYRGSVLSPQLFILDLETLSDKFRAEVALEHLQTDDFLLSLTHRRNMPLS